MAQRRRKPKDDAPPSEPQEQGPPNGVLVTRDGDRLNVQVLGDVRATEAPTLLRLGAKLAEQQLGIEGR